MSKSSSHKKTGIYIHIPFCISKCPYCDFNSYPISGVPTEYISSLIKEMSWAAELFRLEGKSVDTIYFGGGTPSLLKAGEIEKIMDRIASLFSLQDKPEVTLETNPKTVGKETLHAFKKAGINRLSIGIQSFNEKTLSFLGRLHSGEEAKQCFSLARDAGFENISIDLILAVPGQSINSFAADLKEALALKPEHISLYLFTLEEGTPMFKWEKEGKFLETLDSLQEEMFMTACEELDRKGYFRYETSNYALGGRESRHNLKYWNGEDYLGIGAGAHSYLANIGWGLRWKSVKSPDTYIKAIMEEKMPISDMEILDRSEVITETVFTALRIKVGLKEDLIREKTGLSMYEVISEEEVDALPDGLMVVGKDGISLTDRGIVMADEITAKILL